LLSKKVKTIQKKIVGQTTALAGSTTESLRNIELVKSLGLTNQEVDRLNQTTYKNSRPRDHESEAYTLHRIYPGPHL
jgi:hypothetical protein